MKCHCREAHCRQSPTSCTLKPIATPKTPHYHTQITHYECFLILITSDKKAEKPPHIWAYPSAVSTPRYCQSPRICVMPFSRSAQGWVKTSPTIASPTSRDCRVKAAATAPQRAYGSQCGLTTNCHSAAPKYTKSRLTHGKGSQCARRLNDWTARKGGLGRMGYCFLYDWSNRGKIIFGSFLNSFNEISSFSIFFMTSGKSVKAHFSSFFIATRIPLTSSQ